MKAEDQMGSNGSTVASRPRLPRSILQAAVWILLIGLLTLNWFAAVARFQVEGIYWDQWVFLGPLFAGEPTAWELFTQQHGPHRQGLAFVLTAPVMAWAGWDTRIEALWIAGWLVVACLLGLGWKRSLTGRLGWEDMWLPLAFLSLRQFETVLVYPNLSHSVFPMGLLMAMAWVLAKPLTSVRWMGLAGIGAVSLFTGFGVFAWLAAGWVVLLRAARAVADRDGKALLGPGASGLVLGLALVIFLQGYRWDSGSPGGRFTLSSVVEYPEFIVRMLASRMDMAGGAGVALVLGWLVLGGAMGLFLHASWRLWRERSLAVGWSGSVLLLGTALSYGLFTAAGRIHLGMFAAEAPRYTTLMGAIWLGGVAWAAGKGGRKWALTAAVLGWGSVAMSWQDSLRRPIADWPGTLGLSEVSINSISFSNMRKMEWLLVWQETGDWRQAEAVVPGGIFGEPEKLNLGGKIDWLRERELSFADPTAPELDWLPWWNPSGFTWVKATVGERRRWMQERAVLLVEGGVGAFLNLRFSASAPGLAGDAGVEIGFGSNRVELDFLTLQRGISLPIPDGITRLILRSTDGVVPLGEIYGDLRTSFLVEPPVVSDQPEFGVVWWSEDGSLLQSASAGKVVVGLWDWELVDGRSFAWTRERLVLRSHAISMHYWNVRIDARYAPVNAGPIEVRWDGNVVSLPWREGGVEFSVPMRGGKRHRLELINVAGEQSPQAVGESQDCRKLAMRLGTIEFADEAAFPVLEIPYVP